MQIHQQFAMRNDCYTRNQAELAKAPANRTTAFWGQMPTGTIGIDRAWRSASTPFWD